MAIVPQTSHHLGLIRYDTRREIEWPQVIKR